MNQMGRSVYQQIIDHIQDGVIESGFSLPDEVAGDSPVRFAPGAFDGIYMYHMGPLSLEAGAVKQMAAALKAAAKKDFPEADRIFYEWTKENRAVRIVDELQNYVMRHAERLDPTNVYHTAVSLVLNSGHIECVKIGLELLELFGEPEEDIKEIIRRLGLYDEFTLFAVWNMLRWKKGNEEIFVLAKKTRSWGRIHSVERLEPETEEIRSWLLTEGTVNGVMNAYSALTCWRKSGAEEILFGQPSLEAFRGIGLMIEGLLDEGPVPGISRLENAEAILLRFLELAPSYPLVLDDYERILSIRDWAEDEENGLTQVSEACDFILSMSACRAEVEKAVREGEGLDLARALELPFRDQLLECLRKDFDGQYYKVGYLMEDPAYLEAVLTLFLEKLPLDQMRWDSADSSASGDESVYEKLHCLVRELEDKPLTGLVFVKASLESPVPLNRFQGLSVLQEWAEAENTPLAELSPDLFEAVRLLKERETEDRIRGMLEGLLEGRTQFSEDDSEEDEDNGEE